MSTKTFNRLSDCSSGDIFYQWLLLPCNNCHTQEECKRYHDDLVDFLQLPSTVRAVGKPCVDAVKDLQLDMYTKQAKFAGYQRHYVKGATSAMTTSPAEGQILNTRKLGVNAQTPMDRSVKKSLGRVVSNYCDRHAAAQRELAYVSLSSRSPTSQYLNQRGEGLLDRYYDARKFLKSARKSEFTWLTWNNDIIDQPEERDPLYAQITRILRVSQLTMKQDEDGSWFIRCTCGKREDLGVACDCFFLHSGQCRRPRG